MLGTTVSSCNKSVRNVDIFVTSPETGQGFGAAHESSGPLFTYMKEIAQRKECGAESGAGKIEVVTDAMFLAPAHGGEPLKSLGNMGEDDEQKTDGAEELQQRAGSSVFAKEEGCSEQHHDGGNECDKRFE